jgi:hypothetical protein
MLFRYCFVGVLCCLSLCAIPSSAAERGTTGINSSVLLLTGDGIGIGQVEEGRPGKAGVDVPGNLHILVEPADVFRRNLLPDIGDHTLSRWREL